MLIVLIRFPFKIIGRHRFFFQQPAWFGRRKTESEAVKYKYTSQPRPSNPLRHTTDNIRFWFITLTAIHVDMSAQQDAWSANEYNKTAAFVYSDKFTQAVIQLLEPQNGERIVDFGCGSGELTKGLLEAVGETGHVVGIDASPNMV